MNQTALAHKFDLTITNWGIRIIRTNPNRHPLNTYYHPTLSSIARILNLTARLNCKSHPYSTTDGEIGIQLHS